MWTGKVTHALKGPSEPDVPTPRRNRQLKNYKMINPPGVLPESQTNNHVANAIGDAWENLNQEYVIENKSARFPFYSADVPVPAFRITPQQPAGETLVANSFKSPMLPKPQTKGRKGPKNRRKPEGTIFVEPPVRNDIQQYPTGNKPDEALPVLDPIEYEQSFNLSEPTRDMFAQPYFKRHRVVYDGNVERVGNWKLLDYKNASTSFSAMLNVSGHNSQYNRARTQLLGSYG